MMPQKSELFLKQLPEKDFSKITYKGSNDEKNSIIFVELKSGKPDFHKKLLCM